MICICTWSYRKHMRIYYTTKLNIQRRKKKMQSYHKHLDEVETSVKSCSALHNTLKTRNQNQCKSIRRLMMEKKIAKRTRSRRKRWRKDSKHQTIPKKRGKNLGKEENDYIDQWKLLMKKYYVCDSPRNAIQFFRLNKTKENWFSIFICFRSPTTNTFSIDIRMKGV
jgi:hypothetical protein